jgi:hypothetical protein
MRSEGFDFDNNRSDTLEVAELRSGSFAVIPSDGPRILKANDEHLSSQTVEMISSDVPRQCHAKVNILNGTQKRQLLISE